MVQNNIKIYDTQENIKEVQVINSHSDQNTLILPEGEEIEAIEYKLGYTYTMYYQPSAVQKEHVTVNAQKLYVYDTVLTAVAADDKDIATLQIKGSKDFTQSDAVVQENNLVQYQTETDKVTLEIQSQIASYLDDIQSCWTIDINRKSIIADNNNEYHYINFKGRWDNFKTRRMTKEEKRAWLDKQDVNTQLPIIQQYQDAIANLELIANQHETIWQSNFENTFKIFYEVLEPVKPLPSTIKLVSLTDLFLDRTYSLDRKKTESFFQSAIDNFSKFRFTQDVIDYLGLQMAQGKDFPISRSSLISGISHLLSYDISSEPLKFIDALNDPKAINFDAMGHHHKDIGGFYSYEYNIVALYCQKQEYLIHEMGHALTNLMFENNCDPYPKTDHTQYLSLKTDIDAASSNMLNNMALKMGISSMTSENSLLKDFYNNPRNVGSFLGLNNDEIELFYMMLTPILSSQYKSSDYNAEFLAILPQAYVAEIEPYVIDQYCADLQKFWQQHISPTIDKMKEHHVYMCDHYLHNDLLYSNDNFEYCIKEILDEIV